MSHVRATAKLPPPLPPMTTVMGEIDREARRTAARAARHNLSAVRAALPARSGRLRRGQRSSVRRTGTGYIFTVAPSSRERYRNGVTAVEVTRFVVGGTGEHGPRNRRYGPRRAAAFRLPSGWRSAFIRGQRAQGTYRRVQSSEEAATQRILEQGAVDGARAAARALGGAL